MLVILTFRHPLSALCPCRIKTLLSFGVSTMFTALSRATSPSSTTWRVWKLKRRSTKSAGFLRRTLLSSFCRLMVHFRNDSTSHSPVWTWPSSISHLTSVSSLTDKTIKLWKISERDKRPEGYNLKEEDGRYKNPNTITSLRVRAQTKTTLHTYLLLLVF